MTVAQLTSYQEVPYESRPQACTHPDTLAAIATLHGMRPAPPERCRVLELGCGNGGNLIPMALTLPGSTFVGIDLSPGQIAEGVEVIAELGLTNIELKAHSILDVDAGIGHFDYIVCHGVYSWVPPGVQARILELSKDHLSPNGVAYVSYNTYPGWHMKALLRDMLGFRSRHQRDPASRVQASRAFMDLLANALDHSTDLYGKLLGQQVSMLAPLPDYYLFHEHLEDVNVPLYFHEFAARAAAWGLQYLGEAEPGPLPTSLPADVIRALDQTSADLIEQEQYADFLCGRTFRKTLLCHDDVTPRHPPSAEALRALSLTSNAKPVLEAPDLSSDRAVEFRSPDGRSVTTTDPVIKTALALLSEVRPQAVPFDDLSYRVTTERAGFGGSTDREEMSRKLAAALLRVYQAGLVQLQVRTPPFALTPSVRPRASSLSRLQSSRQDAVTNLRHRRVELAEFDRLVLRHLDGTRDRAEIVRTLCGLVEIGTVTVGQDGRPLRGDEARPLIRQALEPSLERLARNALLLA